MASLPIIHSFPIYPTLNIFRDFLPEGVNPKMRFRDLAEDSRKVKPGDLFLAPFLNDDKRLTGTFLKDAVAKGAAAVFLDSRCHSLLRDHCPIPIIIPTENLVQKTSELASIFFGEPSSKLKVVAVTGTNGKTSTSHVIAQALNLIGQKAALIGTLGAGFIGETLVQTGYTCPSPVAFQRLLKELLDAGAEAVAVEASSEGLAKRRIDAVQIRVGIFTNLSPEHLDFHGTMENYRQAKWRLFSDWPSLHTAFINIDTEEGVHLAKSLLGDGFDHIRRTVCFTMENKTILLPSSEKEVVHVFGNVEELSPQGTRVFLETPWGSGRVQTRLIGRTNAYNLLSAVTILCCELGVGFQEALTAISQVSPVPGRLELVRPKEPHQLPRVFVDSAHCEKSLEGILRDLKEVLPSQSRLICVFGCGGERFKQKRAGMGRLAAEMADSVVVTDDNPRFEDPEGIFADIRAGIDGRLLGKVQWEHDRRRATELAIRSAGPEDVVLVAGKGHEAQILKNGKQIPYKDSEVVQEILRKWQYLS